MQRRIDNLFSQTRTALGKFLDPRPISELHDELQQAQEPAQRARETRRKGGELNRLCLHVVNAKLPSSATTNATTNSASAAPNQSQA